MKNISFLTVVSLFLLANTAYTLYYKPPIGAPGEAIIMWMIWFYSSLISLLITALTNLVYTKLCEIEKYLKKD